MNIINQGCVPINFNFFVIRYAEIIGPAVAGSAGPVLPARSIIDNLEPRPNFNSGYYQGAKNRLTPRALTN